MRNRSGEKIKLSGIDELLGVVNEESAMEIDIASIHPFAGHASYRGNDAAYEKKMEDFAEAAMEKVREYSMLFMVIIILVQSVSLWNMSELCPACSL